MTQFFKDAKNFFSELLTYSTWAFHVSFSSMVIPRYLPTSTRFITMFVTSYSVTYYIYIPGKPGFCFHYCAVYDEFKYSDTFWLADRVHLFVHYTITLSSLCKLFRGHWTYKMLVRYNLSSVWVRLSIFSQLYIIQYMGLCVFSLPISLVMIGSIYNFSYYHHQIGSMNYYPLFKVRSRNNCMRCMSLYILLQLLFPERF